MKSRYLVVGLAILMLAAASLACNFAFSTAKVENVRMASDEAGSNVTTTFNQEDDFYLLGDLSNAPDDTKLKASWIAVEAQNVDPNTVIDEVELESGSGPFTFSLEKSMPLWPPGRYRIDLYMNDEQNQSVDFIVEQTAQADLQGLSLALDAQGNQVTNTFPPTENFYLIGELANAADGTAVRVVWSAVDLQEIQSPESTVPLTEGVIDEQTQQLGSGPLSFMLQKNAAFWPAGQYSVDVYLNEALAETLTFQVEGGSEVTAEQVFTALDEDGNSPTEVFAPEDKFYLIADIVNAPQGGVPVRVVWSVVQAEGDIAPGEEINTYEGSVENGRFWASLASNEGRWPLGVYKADLYLDEVLVDTVEFQVGDGSVGPAPSGETAVIDVFLAKDEDGENDTNVFVPTDTLYLIGELVNAPQGAKVEAIWMAEEVEGYAPDEVISEPKVFDFSEGPFSLSLTNDSGSWTKGQYKVDLQLNGETVATRYYLVSDTKVIDPYMATDDTGDRRTSVYGAKQTFYLRFTLGNASLDTSIKTKWYKLGETIDDHVLLDDSEFALGTGSHGIELSNSGNAWETGSYVVDIYLNDYFSSSVYFEVQ